ncbi:ATP-dependent helicase [Pseudonocardia sp. RS11V-5]|uniref:UvrD-helicase domain-containing protein n=1 Tax=Pseudonocardia terrae TaxID=2905831 RepID=UPI001E296FA4|nr:ATP-dependent helicase [Pseudonocardia terrae]MCE3554431.1 ATP-dependent helicase [Pseudonocardia terrae]
MEPLDEHDTIARSDALNLLVIAPPGCGKTELLARRTAVVVERLGRNQKVLALTFSNKAKQNLRQRISDLLGGAAARRFVTVQNFHGLAASIVRAHGRTLGLDPSFAMPGKRTLAAAIKPFTAGLRYDVAMARQNAIEIALRRAKQAPRTDAEVVKHLELLGNEFALIIEHNRQQEGTLHYDDILRHSHRLLSIPAVANLYQHHFGGSIVDEFQDLSGQQLDLAMLASSGYRTFAGDPLQGIYSWAGADPAGVEARLRQVCGEPRKLHSSFRSSPAVLKTVNTVATSLGGDSLHAHHPDRWQDGGASSALTFSSGTDEANWIVATTGQILSASPLATIGVIARSAWRRKQVDSAFARSDTPHTQWDLALDDAGVVKAIRDAAKLLPKDSSIEALRAKILDNLPLDDFEAYNDLLDALEHLEALAEGSNSAWEAVRRLKVRDPNRAVTPGVHLLNAHTGKGQQFDWVFIPGFEGFHIPSGQAKTPKEHEEESRALLVMLSRARHGIILTRAATLVSKNGKVYSPDVSRFWGIVAHSCTLTKAQLEEHIHRSKSF